MSFATGNTRTVVIGADGFIGSHLARTLADRGGLVTAVVTRHPWRLRAWGTAGIEVVGLSREDWWSEAAVVEIARLVEGADAVALLAYRPPELREHLAWSRHEEDVNMAGTLRLATAAADAGARVVFASSADVYGHWRESPVAEADEVAPGTPYGEAKLAVEDGLAEMDLHTVSVRIATVYGPGERGHRAIPLFIEAYLDGRLPTLHGDGVDVRDYVHVRDVCGVLVAAASAPEPPPVVNAGSGRGRTTREILEAVAAALGREPDCHSVPSPRAPTHLVLDSCLAASMRGQTADVPLDQGLVEEVGWLRTARDGKLALCRSRDPHPSSRRGDWPGRAL